MQKEQNNSEIKELRDLACINAGKKLREFREERGLTGIQLADLTHLRSSDISRYESGSRKLDNVFNIINICEALHIPILDFLELYGYKNKESLVRDAFPSLQSLEEEAAIKKMANSILSRSNGLNAEDLIQICNTVEAYASFCYSQKKKAKTIE